MWKRPETITADGKSSREKIRKKDRPHPGALSSPPPASMTLEAALILPLFLFFMLGILSVFDMVLLQSSVSAALFRAGREAAEYAWYARYALEGGEEEAASLNDSLPARAAAAGLSLAWVSGRTEELVKPAYRDLFRAKPFSFRAVTRLKNAFPRLHRWYRKKRGYGE